MIFLIMCVALYLGVVLYEHTADSYCPSDTYYSKAIIIVAFIFKLLLWF